MKNYTITEIMNMFHSRNTRTIRLKKDEDCLEITNNQPSAGPYPSLIGMRNDYWGKNALILVKGKYAYYVGEGELK